MTHPAPTRTDLIEAVEAIRTFHISRDGKLRTRPRGAVVGLVELDRDPYPMEWKAYTEPTVGRDNGYAVGGWNGPEGKQWVAETAMRWRAKDIRHDFLIDLILRHPSRLDDIRYATTVPYREDPAALGGLATEEHIDDALETIRIAISTAQLIQARKTDMRLYAYWIAHEEQRHEKE